MQIINIKVCLLIALMFSVFSFGMVNAGGVFAASDASKAAIQGGIDDAAGTSGGNATDDINSTITTAINILSVVGGIIAVIFLIVGGYKYITSGGDSSKASSARNTIIYAVIGLVIIALSQVIARFVLDQTTNPNSGISTGQSTTGNTTNPTAPPGARNGCPAGVNCGGTP